MARPSCRQHLNHVIADYIRSRAKVETLRSEHSVNCWVSRLYHWLELMCCQRGSSVQQKILLWVGEFAHHLTACTGSLSLKCIIKFLLLILQTKLLSVIWPKKIDICNHYQLLPPLRAYSIVLAMQRCHTMFPELLDLSWKFSVCYREKSWDATAYIPV